MKLLDTNRFALTGTSGRWIHLATIQDGLHEYICMYDTHDFRCYIEEIIDGQLEFITDDNIVTELTDFLATNNITNIKYGLPVADK